MILTERLELIPATIELTLAALEGPASLGSLLCARIPDSWPPEYLDRAALEYTVARLEEGRAQHGWWLHFVVLREEGGADRVLIGSGGYRGPASPEGTVEIGYAIVSDRRRSGYATEAVRGLLDHAFGLPNVFRVIAETLPELEPSIGVLRKCGFRLIGEGSEPGVIRFEITRADYLRL